MTVVHYTNSLSAHQLPLDYELVKLVGAENFRYVYTNERLQGGAQEVRIDEPWIIKEDNSTVDLHLQSTPIADWLENCDLLIVGGIRPIDLMERRLALGKATFYMAERWFKPVNLGVGHRCRCSVPGWVRLFVPSYFKMAERFVKLFGNPHYRFLPIGPWSERDMRLICRVMHPFTSHFSLLTSHFIKWGDFVAPSECTSVKEENNSTLRLGLQTSTTPLKVLWVGRMLDWKRVDTLVSVAKSHSQIKLTLVGCGPMMDVLMKSAANLSNVVFKEPVSLSEVRRLMREHDVYVLPSNAYEGWGAVVLEAMTEGMTVLGTYEAGASAALLPESNLFHCGDWKTLSKLLLNFATPDSQPTTPNPQPTPLPYDYTPKGAAERLLKVASSTSSTLLHG